VRNNSSSLDSLKRIANECTSNFVRKGSLERHSTLASAISNFSTASNSSNNSNSSSSQQDKRFSINPEELVLAYQKFKPVTISNRIFYRHDSDKFNDEDLCKLLPELRRPINQKRLKCLSGILKIDVCSVPDE